MMSNPINWFLNFQASLGLLPENWSQVPNTQMVLGGMAGVIAGFVAIAGSIALSAFFYDDYEDNFDDNPFTAAGFWLSVVLGGAVFVGIATVASVAIVAGLVSMIVGLFFAYKIAFVISILLIGPLLITIGRLKTHKSKQVKTKARSSVSTSSSL